MIHVFDGVLPDPTTYRETALSLPFASVPQGAATFHGIAMDASAWLPTWVQTIYPALVPTLSFFRQSPEGQDEPNYIHTDVDMGAWTAILYLNPYPPHGDGTTFWRHRISGEIEATTDPALLPLEQCAWRDQTQWEPWTTVAAKFNRVVLFPAPYFHSRAIPGNYGTGADARLIQVCFGTGVLPAVEEMSCP